MFELLAMILSKGDKMLEKYEVSPMARRLIHLVLGLVLLFAVAGLLQGVSALIVALK